MPIPLATVTPRQSREIVAAALDHLTRIVLPTGRFIYAHDAGDITRVHDGYNLLRHCGTLWFMARAADDISSLRHDAIRRAAAYMVGKLEPAPWARPDHPSLALVGNGMVKLGGLGLGLLAVSKVGTRPATLPDLPLGLSETIARMHRYALDEIEGEDFRHKRVLATGEVTSFRSDYYTGEAIFSLLVTGPADADLIRVTTSLMRHGYGWPQQSHWMAYAACEAVERDAVPEALGSAYLTG